MRRRAWASAFGLAGVLAVVACKSGAPSKEELDRLIDERLAERGLAPLPSASASGAASAIGAAPSTGSATTNDPAASSLAFLVKLDELMKDYSLPAGEDKSDVLHCITSEAAKTNADLKNLASRLRQATDERGRRARAAYALAFHYDLDWQARKGDLYGCWLTDSGNEGWDNRVSTKADCHDGSIGSDYYRKRVWRMRTRGAGPSFAYSGTTTAPTVPPALMRRMDAAGVKPPARFSCRIDDVVADQSHKIIKCVSTIPSASIRISGDLKLVNVGDLVSVPLAGTKRDPDGVLFKIVEGKDAGWLVDADASSLTVDAAATCPSMADILAALGNSSDK